MNEGLHSAGELIYDNTSITQYNRFPDKKYVTHQCFFQMLGYAGAFNGSVSGLR